MFFDLILLSWMCNASSQLPKSVSDLEKSGKIKIDIWNVLGRFLLLQSKINKQIVRSTELFHIRTLI